MADNSLTIADKKPLQKRYYATINIFITLIIRILENRFTNRILHKTSESKQCVCSRLSFQADGRFRASDRITDAPADNQQTTSKQQPANNNRHSDIPTDNSIPATHHLSCSRHLSHNTPANPRHTNLSHCIPATPRLLSVLSATIFLQYAIFVPQHAIYPIARHLSRSTSSRRSANRQKNSRENFRFPGRLKRSPAYLTALTIASNAFGSFIARSARTLRFRAIPLVLSLPINCE